MSMQNKNKEDRLNVLVSKKLKNDFKIFCIKNNYNFSERIRMLIKKDMDKI